MKSRKARIMQHFRYFPLCHYSTLSHVNIHSFAHFYLRNQHFAHIAHGKYKYKTEQRQQRHPPPPSSHNTNELNLCDTWHLHTRRSYFSVFKNVFHVHILRHYLRYCTCNVCVLGVLCGLIFSIEHDLYIIFIAVAIWSRAMLREYQKRWCIVFICRRTKKTEKKKMKEM